MPDDIRVLIADDHAIVRQGLRAFLELQEGIQIAGEASDGHEAVQSVARLVPDVVLMDLVMPHLDGIEAIRAIRTISPSTKVLVLTSFTDDDKVFAAIKAGAAGYLLKDVQPQELGEAVRAVYRGEALLHPTIAARLMREVSAQERLPAGRHGRSAAPDALTDREMDVLRLIARGQSNKEIALELRVAEKTVKTHVSNILQKLHLADRTQAALYAVREGLAELD